MQSLPSFGRTAAQPSATRKRGLARLRQISAHTRCQAPSRHGGASLTFTGGLVIPGCRWATESAERSARVRLVRRRNEGRPTLPAIRKRRRRHPRARPGSLWAEWVTWVHLCPSICLTAPAPVLGTRLWCNLCKRCFEVIAVVRGPDVAAVTARPVLDPWRQVMKVERAYGRWTVANQTGRDDGPAERCPWDGRWSNGSNRHRSLPFAGLQRRRCTSNITADGWQSLCGKPCRRVAPWRSSRPFKTEHAPTVVL